MTREEAKELLPVITAFVNGKDVQCLEGYPTKDMHKWNTLNEPDFNPLFKYRIKPEWDDLTVGDLCIVNNKTDGLYQIRVFAGNTNKGKPTVFKYAGEAQLTREIFDVCKPFKLSDYGE